MDPHHHQVRTSAKETLPGALLALVESMAKGFALEGASYTCWKCVPVWRSCIAVKRSLRLHSNHHSYVLPELGLHIVFIAIYQENYYLLRSPYLELARRTMYKEMLSQANLRHQPARSIRIACWEFVPGTTYLPTLPVESALKLQLKQKWRQSDPIVS